MKKFILILLLLGSLTRLDVKSQCGANLNGYLSYMNQTMFEDIRGNWTNDNLLHNRLNFKSYIGNNLTFAVELRNRFIFGETVKYFPGYADTFEKDNGWVDMTWNLASDSSYIINSTIDRLYLDLNLGKLQVTIGRQRINWGMPKSIRIRETD